MEERIQKILARRGVASRRKAEELIAEGRVTINGATATLGAKADSERDHIKVDGKLLVAEREPKVYYLFNKPRGVVTSLSDPEGRPTVKDFLKKIKFRVFPVGRLDYDSEGLLLITNDGDFAQAVLHPSKKMPKTYYVKAKGAVDDETIGRLRRGVRLDDGMTAPARVRKVRETASNVWIEMVLYEGKRRQIRRMLESVGHPVIKLRRTAINGLTLKGLGIGEYRPLTPEELRLIREETLQ